MSFPVLASTGRSEGFWGYGPRAGRPTLFGKPSAATLGAQFMGSKSSKRKVPRQNIPRLTWHGAPGELAGPLKSAAALVGRRGQALAEAATAADLS